MSKEKNNLDDKIRDYYASQRLSDNRVIEILSAGKAVAEQSFWRRHARRLAAFAAIVIICGVTIWQVLPIYTARNVAEEVAKKHIKASPPKIITESLNRLEVELAKLKFPLAPSKSFPEELTLNGGHYCSVNGEPAAQLILTDPGGKRYTLFIASSKDNSLSRLRPGVYDIGDVRVKVWHDRGRLFAMAF